MAEKRWVVELVTDECEAYGSICASPEALGNFVRVNASQASLFRIVQIEEDAIASKIIIDAFTVD